ncbi:MAG: HvfC family RiPP maturation protein [Gammaproteobacteria bacterium]
MAEQNNTDFRARQYEFAAHLRDPDNNPAPADVEDRRMAVYRDLFINNVTGFLANSFPILSDILGEDRWKMLVRDFYRDHKSLSPLFPDLPKEFLVYLDTERSGGKHSDNEPDPPFLYELAHYEKVETILRMAEDPKLPAHVDPDGDLLEQVPLLSQLAWSLSYSYPVNEINKESLPEGPTAQPLLLLVYRTTDDAVSFNKLNAVSARLFELLHSNFDQPAISGRSALETIASEMQHPNPDKVIASGAQILQKWRESGVIVGTVQG